MKNRKKIEKIIEVPKELNLRIEENNVVVKSSEGENKKKFNFKDIKTKIEDHKLILFKEKGTKKDKKLINTLAAHIENMVKGLQKKYEYIIEICSVHFPMNVKSENNKLIIKNFLGERKERIIKLMKGVDVEVKGNKIYIKSLDKDKAGTQAAQIEIISRISNKDKRIFQDGLWIIKKEKGRK